ncbi:hypothetical protein C4D60_Mb10t26840 [Musa balbisiana]|uniref:Mono-/di-acylglycerol lipase N-terminal domain-containing protein n=1 Tax=Musa balbisiana TaxID=52838 RepID=A0A4S8J2J4_MUSBA|nr:hypothetical protein C4D60_Mb10t26840 [Musa balbisiana]
MRPTQQLRIVSVQTRIGATLPITMHLVDLNTLMGCSNLKAKDERVAAGRRRIARRPAQPPATWREAVATLVETLRFTYSETLGKWPIGDLAFGIKYLMRRQKSDKIASRDRSPFVTLRG